MQHEQQVRRKPNPGRHGWPGDDLRRDISAALRAVTRQGFVPTGFRPGGRRACRPSRVVPANGPRHFVGGRAIASTASSVASSRIRSGNCCSSRLMRSVSQLPTIGTSPPPSRCSKPGSIVLIEKPSVLSLQELDELTALARRKNVLAKVVYHKLADPDHKKLRTHVVDGTLQHVNNGYCSLLEPKSISGQPVRRMDHRPQSRRPTSPCHYLKLIDFTFAPELAAGPHHRHRPARPRWPCRRPDLGHRPTADRLRLSRWPGGGFRHPHQLGDARQLSRLRRAGGAIPFRQRRLERPPAEARRRGDGRGKARRAR